MAIQNFLSDIQLGDNIYIRLGNKEDGSGNLVGDFTMRHNGTNTFIDNSTGNLYIRNYSDDKNIHFQTDNGSGGITDYIVIHGTENIVKFQEHSRHLDNKEARFGTGSDLKIYHESATGHSHIKEAGTGELRLSANIFRVLNANTSETMIYAEQDGKVQLRYNESAKLETTAGGIDITGTIDASGTIVSTGGNIRVGSDTGKFLAGASNDLQMYHDGNNSKITNITGGLYLGSDTAIGFQSADHGTNYLTLTSSLATFAGDVTTSSSKISVTQADGDDLAKLYQTSADGFLELFTGQATPVSRVKLSSYGDSYIAAASTARVGIGLTNPDEKLHVDGTSRFNGDMHFGSSTTGLVYKPLENSSHHDRFFLMFDYTNNASHPFLTNRTPSGAVVIKTGTAAGGGENEHFRIKGGDGTVDAYFTNVNLGIGTTSPESKTHIIDTSNPDANSGSLIVEGRRDGSANVLTLRARDASNPNDALPAGQGSVIRFQGWDGGGGTYGFEKMGFIQVASEATVGNLDAPSFMAFGTTPNNSGVSSERMRITSAGDIGINNNSPSSIANYKVLEISGDTTSRGGIFYTSSSDGSERAHFFMGGGVGHIGTQTNHDFMITTNNLERMRVTSGGNVGIGTGVNVDEKLHVQGNIKFEQASGNIDVRYTSNGTNKYNMFYEASTDAWGVYYNPSSAYRLFLNSSGNLGIGTSSPSKQLTINGDNAELLINRTGTYADTITMGAPNGVPTIVGGTDLAFGGTGTWTEHMRIKSDGKVGIGTGSSVDEKLHVEGSVNNDDVAIKIENTFDDDGASSAPASALLFAAASNNGYIRLTGSPSDNAAQHKFEIGSTASGSFITFKPSGGTALTLDSSQNATFENNAIIKGDLTVNHTSNVANAPLYIGGNISRGSWNDGLVIDEASGWAATVYKRSNSPKMFTGLYSGNDNYIWMATPYSNSGTSITAPRTDAVLMARPSTDDLQIYLDTHFGGKIGVGTTSPEFALHLADNVGSGGLNSGVMLEMRSSTATDPAGMRFVSQTGGTTNYMQNLYDGANLKWKHWSGSAYVDKITFSNDGDATFAGDVTVEGGHQKILVGAYSNYAAASDRLYIGGDGLASTDAAIYIGNRGNGTGYGYRIYYEGSGSGNDNKLILKSENLGNPVDMLSFTQDGKATFSNGIQVTGGSTGADIYINNTSPTLGFTDSNSFTDANDIYIVRGTSGNKLQFQWYDDSANTTTETFNIDSSGNATFEGNINGKGYLNLQNGYGAANGIYLNGNPAMYRQDVNTLYFPLNAAIFAGDTFTPGLYVNTGGSAVSGTQVAIVKDGNQNLQRWGSSTSGQASYRFRIDQHFKFIGNSGSGDKITIDSATGDLDTDGDVTIGGNLTVTGTSTAVNVEDLNVEQGEITLNYAASSDTSSSAGGAGIRIQDAVDANNDATILWDETNDEFDFSHGITVLGDINTSGSINIDAIGTNANPVLNFQLDSIETFRFFVDDSDNDQLKLIAPSNSNTLIATFHQGGSATFEGEVTVKQDLIVGDSTSANSTQAFGAFDQLRFDNSFSDTNRGPNKIVMHNNSGGWIGGFGIHSGTVSYYTGGAHKFYKTTSQTASTELFDLNGSEASFSVIVAPSVNNIVDLGVPARRWSTVYTSALNASGAITLAGTLTNNVAQANASVGNTVTLTKINSNNAYTEYTGFLNWTYSGTGSNPYTFNLVFEAATLDVAYEVVLRTGRNGNWRNFGAMKDFGYIYNENDGDFKHNAEGDVTIASGLNTYRFSLDSDPVGFGATADNQTSDPGTGGGNYTRFIRRYSFNFENNTTGSDGQWEIYVKAYNFAGDIKFLKA